MTGCPFCTLDPARIVWSNDLVVAIRDGFPVSPGHTLVIPRRHVETWFDASPWEQQAIWQAVEAVKQELDRELQPDGYNVGFNAGEAAGQTVMHLHVHVIPRFLGDMDDPRGGVRGVIPDKQKYDQSRGSPADPSADPFGDVAAFFAGGADQPLWDGLRLAFRRARNIDLLAAFVQRSGLDVIEGELLDALNRGAQVRVLTGDYLGVTHPHALQRLYTLTTEHDGLQVRLYRVGSQEVFHPKAYLFVRGAHGLALVGSSNLSRSALTSGVEWNLRTTAADEPTFRAVQSRFDALFEDERAVPLSTQVLEEYQGRVRVPPQPEAAPLAPQPRPIQAEVLAKLAQTRRDGNRRGLVVMATGLGKTYLSAFDFLQQGGQRALFVAHREEILHQAAETWHRVLPTRSIGFWKGDDKTLDADLLFASVQTLSRTRHLRTFDATRFDYIVIDEFHHAAAHSYRKLLHHFQADFLLGLTATPDRLDGAALLDLCDDNLVARVGMAEGIARGNLVPFRYFGVRDEIDFSVIPWRSGRFDPEALTAAAATEERAAQALREYRRHAPAVRRALVFCCSVAHADFIAAYFSAHGVAAVAVHSGPTSAPRTPSLEALSTGEIEAIVCVDIFNEGVDLPDVNTILMLRPTASPIVFLQQLGRGLRRGHLLEKPHLTVVDFIGNHRSFLVKPQALVALTGEQVAPGVALRLLQSGTLALPDGCHIDIDTSALEVLSQVARLSKEDHLFHTYLQLRDNLGRRPRAVEVFLAGNNFAAVKRNYGTWFDFLAKVGDLSDPEEAVLAALRPWFVDLTKTQRSKSYKFVALQVLSDIGGLVEDTDLAELTHACEQHMRRSVLLRAEAPEPEAFAAAWRRYPLQVFHDAKGFSRQWFALEADRFVPRFALEGVDTAVFEQMTAEIVEWRLREYLDKKRRFAENVVAFTAPIEMVTSHTRGNPILRFDRARRPDIPEGETTVWMDDRPVTLRFVKVACNVATERPGGPNVLPARMRRWFGATAGQPGTRHRVELVKRADARWALRPRRQAGEAAVISLGKLPFFHELAVACGVAAEQYEGHDRSTAIAIETDRTVSAERNFIVQAQGDSMDGGETPIQDGDLVLCEWATVTDLRAVEGRPVLLSGGSGDSALATIKMPVQVDGGWVLRSANPNHPDQRVDPGVTLRVAARVLEVVQERTGPLLWGLYDRDAIAPLFGHNNNPSWRTGHRDVDLDGEPHSVLMVTLVKNESTPIEHRYADEFLSPSELQWESQDSTTVQSAKGRRILGHAAEGRQVHLFVRYNGKTPQGTGEPFTYCGTVSYQRHEGEAPIRVWFRLEHPLPARLFQAWVR